MRTSRGSRGGAFSLFSFQDILTTTIGVVLLVLLVLVLDVTLDTISAVAAADESDEDPIEQMTEAQMQARLQQLNTLLVIARQRGVDGATTWLRDETAEELAEAQRQLRSAQQAHESVARTEAQGVAELTDLHERIEEASARVEALRDEIEAAWGDADAVRRLQELRGEHARLTRQLEGLLANDALVYIKQEDSGHEPILVEIADDWIHVHAHGIAPGMSAIEFPHTRVGTRCRAAFEHIQQLADGRRYPLLLVRPSGARAVFIRHSFDDLPDVISPATFLRKLIDESQFDQGFDLLGEGQTTLPQKMRPEPPR